MAEYSAKWPDEQGMIAWDVTENQTWSHLITRQLRTVENRACDEFHEGLAELALSHTSVPQLSDVNKKLKKTGWKMVPVHGTVYITEFFTLLKNRQFPVANFIRVPKEMDYLQQPDVFHELFGHGPLLLNPIYADFMQWYGGMALGFSPQKRKVLSRLFWYTIEFGLLKTNNGVRIFGGGILSSFAETVFSLESIEPKRLPFDLHHVLKTDYDYKHIQPHYFILESLEQLFELQTDPLLLEIMDKNDEDIKDTFINC